MVIFKIDPTPIIRLKITAAVFYLFGKLPFKVTVRKLIVYVQLFKQQFPHGEVCQKIFFLVLSTLVFFFFSFMSTGFHSSV